MLKFETFKKRFIILALLFLLSACVKTEADAAPAETVTEPVTEVRQTGWNARKINTVDLNGETVTNENFTENKLTMLNVWATWCAPCVRELPELQKISEAYAGKGVRVVGVMQDGVTELGARDEAAIDEAKTLLADTTYLVILPDETLTTEFINDMQYFPTTFFLNAEGAVVRTVIGSKDFENWSKEIDEILKEI